MLNFLGHPTNQFGIDITLSFEHCGGCGGEEALQEHDAPLQRVLRMARLQSRSSHGNGRVPTPRQTMNYQGTQKRLNPPPSLQANL